MEENVDERSRRQLRVLDGTLDRIREEANRYNRAKDHSAAYNRWFRSMLAILGVAAPALVTFQTQPVAQYWYVQLPVIAVIAIAGAAATLQNIFRWDERYRRTLLSSLSLYELDMS